MKLEPLKKCDLWKSIIGSAGLAAILPFYGDELIELIHYL